MRTGTYVMALAMMAPILSAKHAFADDVNPSSAQCAQAWQNHRGEFSAVLEGDFMYVCSDPFPDPRYGFRQLPPR